MAARNGTAPPSDTRIVESLVADLDAGFVEVVRAYQRTILSVAVSVSGGWADAEDLAAEAFLRAYRSLRGFDADRIKVLSIRPWLVTILLNTWRNWLRDSARRPQEVPLNGQVDGRAARPGVEEVAEFNDGQRQLVAMLAELPEPQRVAVVLRHVVGLPMAEVAAAIGCPEGTAKSHAWRGVQRLRQLEDRRTVHARGE